MLGIWTIDATVNYHLGRAGWNALSGTSNKLRSTRVCILRFLGAPIFQALFKGVKKAMEKKTKSLKGR